MSARLASRGDDAARAGSRTGDAWEAVKDPVLTHPHFTGTGTRFLRDNGRAAIEGLFARTFGQTKR